MEMSATFSQALFNLFVWGILFIIVKKAFHHPFRHNKLDRNIIVLLILLFCLFPFFGGDYFHYREMYNEYNMGGFIPLEGVYKWIIANLSFSYLSFRLIVWGSALLILFKAYRRVDVPFDLTIALFASMFMIWFSYARVSLAMAMILLGLTFIVKSYKKKHVLSVIMGICFILCSEAFHRSAIIGIIAAIGSLFLINTNKRHLMLIGLFFPLAIMLLNNLLNEFMTVELDYDSYISRNQRDVYLNDAVSGRQTRGVGELISNILTRTPIFLTAFLYIYSVFKNKFKLLPKEVRCIASYSFLIVLIALAFTFDFGVNTYVLYYRTLTFAMIPSAVFLAAAKYYHIGERIATFIIYLAVSGVVYTLLYSTYCAIVG